ncbi:hypothetical protein DENSPDRAFT_785933 [Dentipellis sp. KUC8613]|nr:hypothetical protein DENSPDRAFT_785933 [Dentipellis sp. KUC8613]
MSLSPSNQSPGTSLAESVPPTSSLLSYPASTTGPPIASTSTSAPASQSRQVLKDRLYVGNLHPSVDEYTLIQLFSKFGKLSHLDFLFHKSGPLKGKPRGYAFVEFVEAADAERALSVAHNKLLRGRRLVVTHAHQAPVDAGGSATYRRSVNEAGRPTALSLLKSGMKTRTKDKIAIMEAKLRQIEQDKARETRSSSPSTSVAPAASSSALPAHPSLPMKPSAQVQAMSTAAHATRPSTSSPRVPDAGRDRSKLPFASKRPAVPPAPPLEGIVTLGLGKSSVATKKSAGTGSALKGVKIGKKKVAAKAAEPAGAEDSGGATGKSLVGLGDGYGSDMDES